MQAEKPLLNLVLDSPKLFLRAIPNELPEVHPSWPDECRIQFFHVVSGHEYDPALGGRDAVDGVQQPGEGQAVQALVGRLNVGVSLAGSKGGILKGEIIDFGSILLNNLNTLSINCVCVLICPLGK
jgi:hypothetical protein